MAWKANRKPRALVIHPDGIDGMKNLTSVAQALGKNVFHTENPIHVYPWNKRFEDRRGIKWYVVVVEEMECTGTQEQGKDDVGT